MNWCHDRIAKLQEYHAAKLSFTAIAGLLRISRSAVAGKCARLKLTRPERDNVANGRIGGKISTKRKRKPNFARTSPAITPRAMNGTAGLTDGISGAPPSLNIPLVDLEPRHCRWPIGDPKQPGFAFCGHEQHPGSSYCPAHHVLCERPA